MNLDPFRHHAPEPEPVLNPEDWDLIPLAGFCAHGVGMLDQCDDCCPPQPAREDR